MSPEDLLNLARTSAGLRELLMSKASKPIWEAARTVQGIPECPSDLSDPQYADLLFGKGCSVRLIHLQSNLSSYLWLPTVLFWNTNKKNLYRTARSRLQIAVFWQKVSSPPFFLRASESQPANRIGSFLSTHCFKRRIIISQTTLRFSRWSLLFNVCRFSFYLRTIHLICTHFFQPVENNTHYGNTILYKAVASQLIELLEKIEELSSSPTELRAYIEDRQNVTRTILEVSVAPDISIKF